MLQVFQRVSIFKTLFVMVTVLAALFAFWQIALAAASNYQISGSFEVAGLTVDIDGTASADPFTGQPGDQWVSVDWDDGSSIEVLADSTDFNYTDESVNGSFSSTPWSGSHTYAASGTYTIDVRVHHASFNGNESSSASITFDVEVLPQCSDGVDNDEDGNTDYPDDLGCSSSDDDDESDDPVTEGSLTVTKTVVNDNGGTLEISDFPLFVGETEVTSGEATLFEGGEYTVSETEDDGYAATFGGDCAGDGTITIVAGESYECTIENNDLPGTLTVIKEVVNDDDGDASASDFSFSVNEGDSTFFEEDGQNDIEVNAGTYTVVEDEAEGYGVSYENCSEIAIENGGSATCTITNDDLSPTEGMVTITKTVVNDNGGTAEVSSFTLFLGLEELLSGIAEAFTPGEYGVSEEGPDGYAATFGGDCAEEAITVVAGESYDCTIENNDIAPLLTVTKTVVNDDETGDSEVSDFTLYVDEEEVVSGEQNEFDAGNYTVSESGPDGYTATFGGDCQYDGSITLALGGEYECTIENDDVAPTSGTLTVIKVIINDNGGTATTSDFALFVDETEVVSEIAEQFEAGEYTISEEGPEGYEASFSEGCTEGTISIVAGEDHECTITNNDIAPLLTVTKVVINDDEVGEGAIEDFDLYVGETEVTSGEQNEFNAGEYDISEESELLDDYEASFSEGCAEGTITLEVGGEYECTITNDDISEEEPAPLCSDGIDNDEDELTDEEDPACWDDPNDSETYNETLDSEDGPVDVCSNLDGYQTEVPQGYTEDEGTCTEEGNGGSGGGSGGGGGGAPTPPSCTLALSDETPEAGALVTLSWTVTSGNTFDISPLPGSVSAGPGSHDFTAETDTTFNATVVSVLGTEATCSVELDVEGGEVLGASAGSGPVADPSDGGSGDGDSSGEVLGVSCGLYMDQYLRRGIDNNPDQVGRLQEALNRWVNAGIPVTEFFGEDTERAVHAFQNEYAEEILLPWGIESSTGIAYFTTIHKINTLECPELTLALPALVAWSENGSLPQPSRAQAVVAEAKPEFIPGIETIVDNTNSEESENNDEENESQTAAAENAGGSFLGRIWDSIFGN